PALPRRTRSSFFFQAEDGIRDRNVTGVQTCALPISVVELTGYAHAFELECLLRQTLLLFADLGIGRLQFGQPASLRERPAAEEPGAAEEDGVDEEGDSGGGRELDEGHLPQI